MEKAIIWGAGSTGITILHAVNNIKYDVVAFIDVDVKKSGTYIGEVKVFSPDSISSLEFDWIIVGTVMEPYEVAEQLYDLGFSKNIIDVSYVEYPYKSRIQWLKNIAELLQEEDGNVAEAGVYRGGFAKYINSFFPEKILYLFDTFEGFDAKDLAKDAVNFPAKHLDTTSMEEVLEKMPYVEKCVIKKGYFPESAKGIDDKFCFVNLDMDLYLPTLEGLRFFAPKMTPNGVILIHDYYNQIYGSSIKRAIQEFMLEEEDKQRHYKLMPIGDSVSIAVISI